MNGYVLIFCSVKNGDNWHNRVTDTYVPDISIGQSEEKKCSSGSSC